MLSSTPTCRFTRSSPVSEIGLRIYGLIGSCDRYGFRLTVISCKLSLSWAFGSPMMKSGHE
ncbi:hypothetical protein PM082_024006 [Marasmius tenuissimus]|nr:hypothetical protein PM082_024006 [Marasmius tenuissimus]